MSLESVFGVGQSALVAQTYRLNVIAENLANAEVAAGTPEGAYKGQYPVFRSVLSEVGDSEAMGVKVDGTVEDQRPARSSYEPEILSQMKTDLSTCPTSILCKKWPA